MFFSKFRFDFTTVISEWFGEGRRFCWETGNILQNLEHVPLSSSEQITTGFQLGNCGIFFSPGVWCETLSPGGPGTTFVCRTGEKIPNSCKTTATLQVQKVCKVSASNHVAIIPRLAALIAVYGRSHLVVVGLGNDARTRQG